MPNLSRVPKTNSPSESIGWMRAPWQAAHGAHAQPPTTGNLHSEYRVLLGGDGVIPVAKNTAVLILCNGRRSRLKAKLGSVTWEFTRGQGRRPATTAGKGNTAIQPATAEPPA